MTMHRHGQSPLQGPKSHLAWQDAATSVLDPAELSAPAQEAARDPDAPIRWDLVRRVKREIAAGTYETPEKWKVALDRLLDRLEQ
jgi:hypothetical protein